MFGNPQRSITDWIDIWANSASVSPASRATYAAKAKRCIILMKRMKPDIQFDNLSAQDFIDLRNALDNGEILNHRGAHMSNYTINLYMAVMRLFYAFIAKQGHPNPTIGVKNLKVRKTYNKKPLTIEQARTLIGSIDTTTQKGRRDKAIVLLMLVYGLRSCEVERIDISDIELDGESIFLHIQRKGHKEKDAKIRIEPQVYAVYQEYMKGRSKAKTGPAFISYQPKDKYRDRRMDVRGIEKMVERRLVATGIKNEFGRNVICTHSLRHTAAVIMLESGAPLDEVRYMLGHTDCRTTETYVAYAQELKMMSNPPSKYVVHSLGLVKEC